MAPSTKRYRVWLEQAYYDIEAAKKSFHHKFYEWTCYQSVQATEKILKAVIVHAGWSPPRTHKLGVLVSIANRAHKHFEKVKFNFRKLEAYTFISRYPFVYPDQKNNTPHELIRKEDGSTSLEIAIDVYTKVNEFLNQESEYPTEMINIDDFYFTPEEVDARIKDVVFKITTSEKLDVHNIILFGSFAREQGRPRTTTMDIIVVAETDMDFIDRIAYVRELTKGSEPIIEPLVYTPKEFDYMLNEEGEGFLESAIGEGKTIWEKQNGNSIQ